ncbi:MAG: C4-type zinc ribbon domain-containing protein [Deltaproteobacteria bacterium]|nr:C4-type zinc ribbon domain-containing protein [Deltaproteobacteria bacterium]
MSDSVKTVLKLSNQDRLIQNHRKKLEVIPEKKKRLKQYLASLEKELGNLRNSVSDISTQVREREILIMVENEKIEKSNQRMLAVKNQKEFAALQKEIDAAKKTVKRVEDQILDLEEKKEPLEEELSNASKDHEKKLEKITNEHNEISEKEKGLTEELETTLKARDELLAKLNEDIRSQYNKLIRRNIIPAAVEINSGNCLGCAMTIRPQVFNDIIRNAGGVCPNCQRILIYKPPEEPEPDVKGNKKKT